MAATAKKTPGVKEQILDRQQRVWELRKAGFTIRTIAAQVQVSVATINKDLSAVTKQLVRETLTDAQALRAIELSRLDMAMAAIASSVSRGDLHAIDRWVKISESRRKLLGLDLGQGDISINLNQQTNNIFAVTPVDYRDAIKPLAPEDEPLLLESGDDASN